MRFSIATAFLPPEEMVPIARAADDAGYHAMALSDHIINLETLETPYPYTSDGGRRWEPFTPWVDPMVTIGALGAITENLRFFTNVYVLPMRNPLAVAKSVSTASILTGGRLSLGVGMGWCEEEFDLVGEAFRRRGKRAERCSRSSRSSGAADGWSTGASSTICPAWRCHRRRDRSRSWWEASPTRLCVGRLATTAGSRIS